VLVPGQDLLGAERAILDAIHCGQLKQNARRDWEESGMAADERTFMPTRLLNREPSRHHQPGRQLLFWEVCHLPDLKFNARNKYVQGPRAARPETAASDLNTSESRNFAYS
jgi:hypothetical protein